MSITRARDKSRTGLVKTYIFLFCIFYLPCLDLSEALAVRPYRLASVCSGTGCLVQSGILLAHYVTGKIGTLWILLKSQALRYAIKHL